MVVNFLIFVFFDLKVVVGIEFGYVEVGVCKVNCKDVLVMKLVEIVIVVGVFIKNCFCVVLV